MEEIPILGVVVVLIAIIVGARLRVPIISSYYSFIAFSALYCAYMYIGSTIKTGGLSLLENQELVHNVILTTFSGLLCFVFFYRHVAVRKRRRLKGLTGQRKEDRLSKSAFLPAYLALLVVLVVFAHSYGWHAVSRDGVEGILPSLFAYGKYFFVCMGLTALWCKPLSKKWVVFILLTQTILMIFDGGRTTFFGLVVAYGWILSKNGINLKISQAGYLVIFGLVMLGTRALVLGGSLIGGMVSSVVAEGIFAGYTGLQMADYVHGGGGLLYGITYLFDPIIYLLPQGVREHYLFMGLSINNYNGQENFAPMGGFFWIAEAIANFGSMGGVIVGSAYGYLLAKLEFGRGIKNYYKIFVIAPFGCMLSKFDFALGIKIAIFYLGAAFIIRILFVSRRSVVGNINSEAAPVLVPA